MSDLLVRHLLESTLFCLLMAGLTCCCRAQSSGLRYALWLLGVAKFTIPAAILKSAGADLAFLVPASDWVSWAAAKMSVWLAAVFGFLPARLDVGGAAGTRVALTSIWLVGVIWLFGRWWFCLRQPSMGVGAPSNRELGVLRRACGRLGVARPPGLFIRECNVEPGLRGVFHPTLVVPRELAEQLEDVELEAIFVHELAHARRYDNLAAVLVHAVVCVFWFHPLLWLAERWMKRERERACDQVVVRAGVRGETYVAGIVKACRFHLFASVAGVSGIGSSDLAVRLRLILAYRQRSRVFAFLPGLLVAVFAASMTLLPMAGGYCEQCVSNGHGVMIRAVKTKLE